LFPGIANDGAIERMIIRAHPQWKLSAESEYRFKFYLETQIDKLNEQLPGLNLPQNDTNLQNAFLEFENTDSPSYRLRDMECRFLRKIKSQLQGELLHHFETLTHEGKICIPADLDVAERSDWMLTLFEFFSYSKWIQLHEESYSLVDLIQNRLKLGTIPKPNFHILEDGDQNAFAYAWSPKDLAKLDGYPVTKAFINACAKWDINNPTQFPSFGEDATRFFLDNVQERAAYCVPDRRIYISNNWPPSTVVEILTHEWGHLYHFANREIITQNEGFNDLILYTDPVHEEAIAEAFASLVLAPIYKKYPETKRFHILKQNVYYQQHEHVPHVLGTAAFLDLFHSPSQSQLPWLFKLTQAKTLDRFLSELETQPLEKIYNNTSQDVALDLINLPKKHGSISESIYNAVYELIMNPQSTSPAEFAPPLK